MTALWIIVPLALLAIGLAVFPVLVGSIVHDRSVKEGEDRTTERGAQEANEWHTRLGRRTRRRPHQLEPGANATVANERRR